MRPSLWRSCVLAGALASALCLVAIVAIPGRLKAGSAPAGGPGTVANSLDDTCGNCHAQAIAEFRLTLHGRRFRDFPHGGDEQADCASCHGPLEPHAQDPEDPASIRSLRRARLPDPRRRSEPCITCHATDALSGANHSRHQNAGVACGDCHTVMRPASSRKLLAAPDVNALCASCHATVDGQRHARSTHIAVGSGLSCTDCHNPHGALKGALKGDTVNETCAPCHRAQSGPFLFEHAPVEENCLTCHAPHGAPEPALLKRDTGALCLSCHSQAPFFHNFTGLDRFTLARGCANCHNQIHGSNHATGSRLMR